MGETVQFIKNFSGLTSLEQVTAQLDLMFAKLAQGIDAKPQTHSLLNAKAAVPNQKAGDFVIDYRDGKVAPGMSNGKEVIPFEVNTLTGVVTEGQHGEQPAELFDEDGNVIGQLHPNGTTSSPGFITIAQVTKLNGIGAASNAVPVDVDASAGSAGASSAYSRSDHVHQVAVGTPVTIGTANAAGASVNLARADHVHNHGAQTNAAHHAIATTSANGFMSAADKTELNRLNAFNFEVVNDAGSIYIRATLAGTTYRFGPGFI